MSSPTSPSQTSVPSKTGGSLVSKFAVLFLAVAVLGGAGWIILGQVRELWPEFTSKVTGEPSPSDQPVSKPTDWSPVVVARENGKSVVRMSRTNPLGKTQPGVHPGLLGRELFRQALCVAATDGLGASTIDLMMSDPEAQAPSDPSFVLHYAMAPDGKVQYSLWEPGLQGKALWKADFEVQRTSTLPIAGLVETLEALSRGGLVDALKTRGVLGPGGPSGQGDPSISPAASKALDRLTFVSQFGAVRLLTEQVRSVGSAEQVGALARAYANLGVLTEYHENAWHKAFEARALLGSQRLVVLEPDSPRSYWTRAYVRALVGLPREALNDLAEADKRLARLPSGQKPIAPSWVSLVDKLCRFDTKGLLAASKDPKLDPLASMFALMTVYQSKATSLALEVAAFANQVNPDNLWVNDAASQIKKLSHLHVATLEGLSRFASVIPIELKALPDLPVEVKGLVDGSRGEVAIVEGLIAAGGPGRDPVDLSWAVLGRMIRDARFAQVSRRVEFMSTMWSVPVDEFLDQVRPVFAGHPHAPMLLAYTADPDTGRRRPTERLEALLVDDLEITKDFQVRVLKTFGPREGAMTSVIAARLVKTHADPVDRDQVSLIRHAAASEHAKLARSLAEISPYSPIAEATLIAEAWDPTVDKGEEIEARHAGHPEVLVALGKRYAADRQLEDAERVLSTSIKISPDHESYAALAGIYKSLGKLDRWKETLQAFLETSDPGLDHAKVEVELARYHMGRREYDQALPFAEAAAQTWAGWAMLCAAECNELMGRLEPAEAW